MSMDSYNDLCTRTGATYECVMSYSHGIIASYYLDKYYICDNLLVYNVIDMNKDPLEGAKTISHHLLIDPKRNLSHYF